MQLSHLAHFEPCAHITYVWVITYGWAICVNAFPHVIFITNSTYVQVQLFRWQTEEYGKLVGGNLYFGPTQQIFGHHLPDNITQANESMKDHERAAWGGSALYSRCPTHFM